MVYQRDRVNVEWIEIIAIRFGKI